MGRDYDRITAIFDEVGVPFDEGTVEFPSTPVPPESELRVDLGDVDLVFDGDGRFLGLSGLTPDDDLWFEPRIEDTPPVRDRAEGLDPDVRHAVSVYLRAATRLHRLEEARRAGVPLSESGDSAREIGVAREGANAARESLETALGHAIRSAGRAHAN